MNMTPRAAALTGCALFYLGAAIGAGAAYFAGAFPISPQRPPMMDAEFERCMAGWKQTIADWNASTARLEGLYK